MEGLDGMTGLIPLVVTSGIVMHMSDRMLGSNMAGKSDSRPKRRRTSTMKGRSGKVSLGRIQSQKLGSLPKGPGGLGAIMKGEGAKVRRFVGNEKGKLGSGSLGSLPGIGKITLGKLGDLGTNSTVSKSARKDMGGGGKKGAYSRGF